VVTVLTDPPCAAFAAVMNADSAGPEYLPQYMVLPAAPSGSPVPPPADSAVDNGLLFSVAAAALPPAAADGGGDTMLTVVAAASVSAAAAKVSALNAEAPNGSAGECELGHQNAW
jgi:hypothetical protein